MLVYRVFAWLPDVGDEVVSGHPLYVHRPGQLRGRWDNRDLYAALYVADTPAGAIGERLAHLAHWSRAALVTAMPEGGELRLATLRFDEDSHPTVDFNDTNELEARKLRPRDIVERNYLKTQRIARDVFHEEYGWAGITWWSTHRANWTLRMLWSPTDVHVDDVAPLPGHPGVLDAAQRLAKVLDDDLHTS